MPLAVWRPPALVAVGLPLRALVATAHACLSARVCVSVRAHSQVAFRPLCLVRSLAVCSRYAEQEKPPLLRSISSCFLFRSCSTGIASLLAIPGDELLSFPRFAVGTGDCYIGCLEILCYLCKFIFFPPPPPLFLAVRSQGRFCLFT